MTIFGVISLILPFLLFLFLLPVNWCAIKRENVRVYACVRETIEEFKFSWIFFSKLLLRLLSFLSSKQIKESRIRVCHKHTQKSKKNERKNWKRERYIFCMCVRESVSSCSSVRSLFLSLRIYILDRINICTFIPFIREPTTDTDWMCFIWLCAYVRACVWVS